MIAAAASLMGALSRKKGNSIFRRRSGRDLNTSIIGFCMNILCFSGRIHVLAVNLRLDVHRASGLGMCALSATPAAA